MRISDSVANYILELLENYNGSAEIQRNELASTLGCVPSQINYVITSRFTPEQGYLVESRRGGGGYIRITRITRSANHAIMHLINSIGSSLDSAAARAMLGNLYQQGLISAEANRLIAGAISDRTYLSVPPEFRDSLRAAIFKNLLMITVQQKS